ncbi:hypothetical protein F3K43_08350 [Streptomyces sp. LBUM 1476]|nr:hypothetical protein [Streptomyces sp. LBUM 1476]
MGELCTGAAGPTPVCPGERHITKATARHTLTPMREPPRGPGQGKPSVSGWRTAGGSELVEVNPPPRQVARRPAASRTMSTRERMPSLR